jgi:hypothetical protein
VNLTEIGPAPTGATSAQKWTNEQVVPAGNTLTLVEQRLQYLKEANIDVNWKLVIHPGNGNTLTKVYKNFKTAQVIGPQNGTLEPAISGNDLLFSTDGTNFNVFEAGTRNLPNSILSFIGASSNSNTLGNFKLQFNASGVLSTYLGAQNNASQPSSVQIYIQFTNGAKLRSTDTQLTLSNGIVNPYLDTTADYTSTSTDHIDFFTKSSVSAGLITDPLASLSLPQITSNYSFTIPSGSFHLVPSTGSFANDLPSSTVIVPGPTAVPTMSIKQYDSAGAGTAYRYAIPQVESVVPTWSTLTFISTSTLPGTSPALYNGVPNGPLTRLRRFTPSTPSGQDFDVLDQDFGASASITTNGNFQADFTYNWGTTDFALNPGTYGLQAVALYQDVTAVIITMDTDTINATIERQTDGSSYHLLSPVDLNASFQIGLPKANGGTAQENVSTNMLTLLVTDVIVAEWREHLSLIWYYIVMNTARFGDKTTLNFTSSTLTHDSVLKTIPDRGVLLSAAEQQVDVKSILASHTVSHSTSGGELLYYIEPGSGHTFSSYTATGSRLSNTPANSILTDAKAYLQNTNTEVYVNSNLIPSIDTSTIRTPDIVFDNVVTSVTTYLVHATSITIDVTNAARAVNSGSPAFSLTAAQLAVSTLSISPAASKSGNSFTFTNAITAPTRVFANYEKTLTVQVRYPNLTPLTYTEGLPVVPFPFTIASSNGGLVTQQIHDDLLVGITLSQVPLNVTGLILTATHAASFNATVYRLNTSLNASGDKTINETWAERTGAADGTTTLRKMSFPLFRINDWLDSGKLKCNLDHGVKGVSWVRLMGYSIFNKRQVGFQHAHEMIADDWVAMSIDEVPGGVVSNQRVANGCFAVLHVGGSHDAEVGAVEYHRWHPDGLQTYRYDQPSTTLRALTMRFLDRQGTPAHFGRIHLWFKVCVAHG